MSRFLEWVSFYRVEIAITTAAFAMVLLVLWMSFVEERRWAEFVKENDCVIVGVERGETSTGVGVTSGGQTVVLTSSTATKTTWLCKDGVRYTR